MPENEIIELNGEQLAEALAAPLRPVFERKSFTTDGPVPNLELKLVDADAGVWEAYASTFKDTPDPYGDVVDKGAFKKTIKDNARRIRNLWNHNVNEPIGRPLAMSEDSHGLLTKNKLSLGVQRAREARDLMADGVINEVSIGFDTITDRLVEKTRHLVEVRLWDISPVTYAANEEALILSVKSQFRDLLSLPADAPEGMVLAAMAQLKAMLSPDALKEGRVLSKANLAKVKAAIEALQALLDAAVREEEPAKSTLPPTDEGAAELEAAMADFEAACMGIDVRDATARIEELLATL